MALTDKLFAIGDAIRTKTNSESTFKLVDMPAAIMSISGINDAVTEFSQVNAQAAAYLAAADAAYTDSNSTSVTVMPNYAGANKNYDDPPGYTITPPEEGKLYLFDEDQPERSFRKTVGASAFVIHHLIPGHIWRYAVVNSGGKTVLNGKLKPTGDLRMIYLSDTDNFRDLGGWDCAAGKIKYGLLYRGAELRNYTSNYDILKNTLGIKCEVDFREGTAIESTIGETVSYYRFPMYGDSLQQNLWTDHNDEWYVNVKNALMRIMQNAVNGIPTYYHCSLGCDRTGVISFMLGVILGMSRADLDKEYELSALSGTVSGVDASTRLRTRSDWNNMISYLSGFGRSTIHKNVLAWCSAVGIPVSLINQFRSSMCTGIPEDVIYTHLVSANLTKANLTNTVTEVQSGSGYTTNVSATGSNRLESVVITMGGVDITSTAYNQNTGMISIGSVTGDIVITAVAELPYTNQIPISQTATSTEVYNGVGYKNIRIGSSGTDSNDSYYWSTGFIPVNHGDTIRLSGITMRNANINSATPSNMRFALYNSNKGFLYQRTMSNINGIFFDNAKTNSDGDIVEVKLNISNSSFTGDISGVKFIRICASKINSNSVITVNEEIV